MKYLFYIFLLQSLLFSTNGLSLSYDWKEPVNGLITRCFETKDIKVECEDLSDYERQREPIKELEISVTDTDKKFFYSYERGNPGSLCDDHYNKIKALLKNTKEVCITGGREWLDKSDNTLCSKWVALETRKGRVDR